jgi:myo-inositol-1(or 4)-monophosphatase
MSPCRIYSRWNSWLKSQHSGSSLVASPDTVRDSPDHRHQNVVDPRASPRQMKQSSYSSVLERIEAALAASREIFARFTPGKIETEYKSGHDPVTDADRALDAALRKNLLREGEGWLSEESADDLSRLDRERVWVVDPLDGTREFVQGIPEFCVSIAMVERGQPVAAGICNPATNETFIGAIDCGLTHNGAPARSSQRRELQGAVVLASRSETKRGEWEQFQNAPFKIRPMGSVAYKLARVAAGLEDITFTLTPKNEWDVAGGAALIASAGGFVQTLREPLTCNRKNPLIDGLIACGPALKADLLQFLAPYLQPIPRQ